MRKYNTIQKLLLLYCQQRNYSNPEITGVSTCTATDPQGRERHLTVNVYGDIMDNDIKMIIAVGKVSHDIRATFEWPDEWIDVRPKKDRELKDYREKKPKKRERAKNKPETGMKL
jgi:hypothetical protein